MTWMKTFTGRKVDFVNPEPHNIDIRDIAHALSQICRFGGHAKHFYSVAQHSILVSQLLPQEDQLAGLLHDAAESYTGDIVTPLKSMFADFKIVEARINTAIMKRFGLKELMNANIKIADAALLSVEFRDVMGIDPITLGLDAPIPDAVVVPWPSYLAEERFLEAFESLYSTYSTERIGADAAV